jgi:hypothetical protein
VAKKRPEERTGAAAGAINDPRFIVLSQGRSLRHGIPIPEVNPQWHPQARSWYNALKLSGQSSFYEASDWATAVLCAQLYDMFMRTRSPQFMAHFVKLSAQLGVTIVDRKRNRIELDDPDVSDVDEEAADEAVIKWHGRLGLVEGSGADG